MKATTAANEARVEEASSVTISMQMFLSSCGNSLSHVFVYWSSKLRARQTGS